MFFGVLVSAWASGTAEAAVWHWAFALVLLAGALFPARPVDLTWVGAVVACLIFWTIFHTLFISESYSPAGFFHPLFLAIGFALGRRASVREGEQLWLTAAALALAGIVCYALVDAVRAGFAAAPFETPAVLAALINLTLMPILVYSLWGSPPPPAGRLIALTIFFAGLIGAASRGGWIGFLVGLACALIFFRGRLPAMRNALAVAASASMAAGLVLFIHLARDFLGYGAFGSAARGLGLSALFLAPSAQQADSSVSRLELYAVALEAARQYIPLGSGYLSFAQVLEAGRDRVPSFGSEDVTFFVHNDYLQTLLELGLPGLCALLALVLVPLALLFRRRDRLQPADALLCGACASGLATMMFHASVDFPFYIPICLAMFGLALGVLDGCLASAGIGRIDGVPRPGALSRALVSARRVSFATGLALLLVPLAAERSLAYGNARWRDGLGEEAAYGFELARRLQPSDWRYAWFAGQFWAAQAAATRNPKAVALADASFAGGYASNRLEVRNLLGRIELRLSTPQLLAQAGALAELDAWSVKALALAPRNPLARMDRVFVLERSGRLDEARREAARFAFDEPENPAARALAHRLARRAG